MEMLLFWPTVKCVLVGFLINKDLWVAKEGSHLGSLHGPSVFCHFQDALGYVLVGLEV